jgi:hypothetical protein
MEETNLENLVWLKMQINLDSYLSIYHAFSIGTDDSDELYASFFIVMQSIRLYLFDSKDGGACPVETLMNICQSTRHHIAEFFNLESQSCRNERHEGLWVSGSAAALILILNIIWRQDDHLQAPSALLPGEIVRYTGRSVRL